jgi:hypothetical protein
MPSSESTCNTIIDYTDTLSQYFYIGDHGRDMYDGGFALDIDMGKQSADCKTVPAMKRNQRSKRLFTPLEKSAINSGVIMYGEGQWCQIKRRFAAELGSRTPVNIKDCYRNMKNKEAKAMEHKTTSSTLTCECCGKPNTTST